MAGALAGHQALSGDACHASLQRPRKYRTGPPFPECEFSHSGFRLCSVWVAEPRSTAGLERTCKCVLTMVGTPDPVGRRASVGRRQQGCRAASFLSRPRVTGAKAGLAARARSEGPPRPSRARAVSRCRPWRPGLGRLHSHTLMGASLCLAGRPTHEVRGDRARRVDAAADTRLNTRHQESKEAASGGCGPKRTAPEAWLNPYGPWRKIP
jgi:hypothetical protein